MLGVDSPQSFLESVFFGMSMLGKVSRLGRKGEGRLVSQQVSASQFVVLPPNKEFHPTSPPSEACFNLRGQDVGGAAGELGC